MARNILGVRLDSLGVQTGLPGVDSEFVWFRLECAVVGECTATISPWTLHALGHHRLHQSILDPAVPGLLAARLCRVSVVVLLAVRRSKLSGDGFSMSRVTGAPQTQKKSC